MIGSLCLSTSVGASLELQPVFGAQWRLSVERVLAGLPRLLPSYRIAAPADIAASPAPRGLAFAESTDKPEKTEKKKLTRAQREERILHLIDLFMAGHEDAFNELAELVRDQIYTVAWRYSGHREDALDITQNVLIRMYRALPRWRGQSRFSTWVHRITMNASVDFFRRQSRHDANRVDPEQVKLHEEGRGSSDPYLGTSAETPRHTAQRREVIDRVMQELPNLSEMQRECFVLRHFHDLPLERISDALGCSEGSVKRHLFRATRKLRDLLTDLEAMLEDGTLSPKKE